MAKDKDSALEVDTTRLAARLSNAIEGQVLFDKFSRGRYATDASVYQIEPLGVVVPRTWQDVYSALELAVEHEVPVLPRGGGTSQCGQTVARALVIDVSAHLNNLIGLDAASCSAVVEPGMVLDQLNAQLAGHGLMFAVDVSTASRATLGGMAGNNSCGARSIRYGTMRDNVNGIDAILANGQRMAFGTLTSETRSGPLVEQLLSIGRAEAGEIRQRFPDVQRRVGGYNIDALIESPQGVNLAHLLVGSEGTLAFSEKIHLRLHPIPEHKVLGVCHFPRFYEAMDAAQHIVTLDPSAVELIDRTMIDLSREIPIFRSTVDCFVRGEPEALLLVEFSGLEESPLLNQLRRLDQCMNDLGFSNAVVEAVDPAFQKAVWEVRKAGLNIMMSMKGDGKPVSFIEDCAVRLEDLAEYTKGLTEVFEKHGTTGTWYAHASVGCLHVRPVINLKEDAGAKKMRAIAEEAFEMVRRYKGSHSGEHGDGLVRSEFHEPMFGRRMVENFRQVKRIFDPGGMMNPGKIVDPARMDDRTLFRYKPGYNTEPVRTALNWSEWGSFAAAVEMCNNNGACRKRDANVMCPSYRATGEERHLTRGRANSLRLALSGQLGASAFTSDDMYDTMSLCVSCKGCKRECPTGVDMARMKIEFLHHYHQRHGWSLRDKLVAHLPRYAATASRLHRLANLPVGNPAIARFAERTLGLSAKRRLPRWSSNPFSMPESVGQAKSGQAVLFADTFNRYFEPENLSAAMDVLKSAGYAVRPAASRGTRPLCCGRTYLAAGMVEQAKREATRTASALEAFVDRGIPVVGLEPSCVLTFRDEMANLIPAEQFDKLASGVKLFEEFLAAESRRGNLELSLQPKPGQTALLHGHCHQKAFGLMDSVTEVLELIPGLKTSTISSSCCGMAGAFGYQRETYEVSVKMAELSLLPSIRAADQEAWVVADGTSCRHQITDLSGRSARHVALILRESLADPV